MSNTGERSLCVGLFGGSFDPPHIAHILVAGWALAGGFASGALVTGVLALNASADADQMLQGPVFDPTDLGATRDRARSLGLTTDILASAAIVTAGLSLYWTLVRPARGASSSGGLRGGGRVF